MVEGAVFNTVDTGSSTGQPYRAWMASQQRAVYFVNGVASPAASVQARIVGSMVRMWRDNAALAIEATRWMPARSAASLPHRRNPSFTTTSGCYEQITSMTC